MTLKVITGITLVLITLLLPSNISSIKQSKLRQVKPGCRYDGRRYEEGAMVNTSEPCLQCRCIDSSLRCRLRVCPRLPNSSPPGCHIRQPEENVCCAELICGGPRDTENTFHRANTETEEKSQDEGCLYEGVRYGPGSAMKGSRRCEYCYCISGARRCIRPKCLLPLPGCIPLYTPHSCCPIAYNCTHSRASTSTPLLSSNGCQVGDRNYEEGEMVREINWKTPCDNCFCAMGAVRCVPLACAPPLQGCSPIVRDGQCCPSTYNCSGSIEVKATQNYASYAFISKDYAKFRKETNFFPAIDRTTTIPPVEGRGHRIVEERIDGRTITVDGESSVTDDSTSWPSTFPTEIMDNEILIETMPYTRSIFEASLSTTLNDEITTNTVRTIPDSILFNKDLNGTTEFSRTYSTNAITETSLIIANDLPSTEEMTTSMLESMTISTPDDTFTNVSKYNDLNSTQMDDKIDQINDKESTTTEIVNDELSTKLEITTTTILDNDENTTGNIDKGPLVSGSSSIIVMDDILAVNVTVKTNVSVGHIQGVTINPIRSIPPDVEAILNITYREKVDDYSEYDYSEPTLPPSLPNVRIIPFVAADALVKNKDVSSAVTGYPFGSVVVPPELRPTDTSGFYDIATQENGFSPPIETEGGFVPREPPPYFDNPYHSTDLNLKIDTGVTAVPAQITGPHLKNGDLTSNCLFESREYRHGDILPSTGICIICVCFYGNVVCSGEKCPPLKIGCQRINTPEGCCGKITCVNAEESPTVVLNRVDSTAPSSQRQPIVSPDPFRDVIKTEPAPDLPSLMEDMIPYIVEHGITTSRPTRPTSTITGTTTTTSTSTSTTIPMTTPSILQNQGSSKEILKHVSNFDYTDKVDLIHTIFDFGQDIDVSLKPPKNVLNVNYDNNSSEDKYLIKSNHNDQRYDQLVKLPDIITISNYNNNNNNNNNTISNISDIFYKNSSKWRNSTNEIKSSQIKNGGNSGSGGGVVVAADSTTIRPVTIAMKTVEHQKDNIFSFGSVFNLLFSSNDSNEDGNDTTSTITTTTTTPSTITTSSNTSTSTTTSITTTTSMISATKNISSSDNEGSSSSSSLLKDQEIRNQDVNFSFIKRNSSTALSSTKLVDTTTMTTTMRTTTTTTTTTKYGNNEEDTTSKILDNEIPLFVSSLLKLAGCNIYGRMYRVGRIITEISDPCRECRCTEIGVQCKQLQC